MKPHLLLVDDDLDELTILSDLLKDAGIDCKCTWSTSPHHALEILRYLQVDFIFMDYNMPKLNGIECITQIRELKRCDHIPIILYSSELDDSLVNLAHESGAQYCIKKTSDLATLNIQLRLIFTKIQLKRLTA